MTLAIALTVMVAGCISVAVVCLEIDSVLLGAAVLIARYLV